MLADDQPDPEKIIHSVSPNCTNDVYADLVHFANEIMQLRFQFGKINQSLDEHNRFWDDKKKLFLVTAHHRLRKINLLAKDVWFILGTVLERTTGTIQSHISLFGKEMQPLENKISYAPVKEKESNQVKVQVVPANKETKVFYQKEEPKKSLNVERNDFQEKKDKSEFDLLSSIGHIVSNLEQMKGLDISNFLQGMETITSLAVENNVKPSVSEKELAQLKNDLNTEKEAMKELTNRFEKITKDHTSLLKDHKLILSTVKEYLALSSVDKLKHLKKFDDALSGLTGYLEEAVENGVKYNVNNNGEVTVVSKNAI